MRYPRLRISPVLLVVRLGYVATATRPLLTTKITRGYATPALTFLIEWALKVSARFKPLAVHVLPQSEDNAVHWFLEDKTDVRSSNYLEEAATEIQVQGLEVDYACVLWDADMRYDNGKWSFWKFNGKTQWIPEKNIETQKYMLNAYRVLLTRARQGMVICVPEGNSNKTADGFPEDPTRLPAYYNSTYEYLKDLGLKEI